MANRDAIVMSLMRTTENTRSDELPIEGYQYAVQQQPSTSVSIDWVKKKFVEEINLLKKEVEKLHSLWPTSSSSPHHLQHQQQVDSSNKERSMLMNTDHYNCNNVNSSDADDEQISRNAYLKNAVNDVKNSILMLRLVNSNRARRGTLCNFYRRPVHPAYFDWNLYGGSAEVFPPPGLD
jgi:hypothetical protein